ncbi:MAG: ABC transporter substrate-binding protein [Candidatus Rokubacteria bacterium]|nr:ABC transporter substrate-binding protein [Candidatus Rokubacteria bacterium]
MRFKSLLLGTSVSLGVIVLLSGFATAAEQPKRGGTLRVSYGNAIAHLDFHTAPGYEMMWVAMNVGCGLVNITPDGKFVGDAAESWQISPDGLLYTFKLRKNVLFHDGTKVDAAAVKFSIDRLIDPATKSGMRTFYDPVHSVEVLDPHTVQIRLKQPYAFLLHMLAGYRTGLIIYSPTATQKYSLEDRKKGKPEAVVGCGPFRLVEWVKGSHLVMDRFDKYFQPGLPYLDRVHIRIIKDPVTQMAAFKAGEMDFIASFSPEHVDTLKAQNPKAQILTGKETTPMVAAMKVTVPRDGKPMSKDRAPHPIFGDLRVRKAVGCYGIDRNEIVKIAFKGQATPWVGMIPPGTLDTVDVNSKCPYDPAKAKAMLAEAGYGPQKPLTLELMTNPEKSVFNVIATVIKEQLARIGVTANIRIVDKVSWMNTTLNDGPWDMYVEDLLSLLTPDSNAYLSNTTSSWSHPRHNDKKVDEFYARYAREMDAAKRKAIAKELQDYMADQVYWNNVSGSPFYMVAQPWMKGYVYNAEFEVHYHRVWLDK